MNHPPEPFFDAYKRFYLAALEGRAVDADYDEIEASGNDRCMLSSEAGIHLEPEQP